MRVFVAGATGAIGKRLVPQLRGAGHQVVAMTRSPSNEPMLRDLGAEPVIADGLDRRSVVEAVKRTKPEAVVHQMTALTGLKNFRRFDREFELTNRLRTEGLDNLLAGAEAVGARRIVVQGYAGWPSGRGGDRVKTEDVPLDPEPLKWQRRSLEAIRYLEHTTTGAGGVVLRYGGFYGPGSMLGEGGAMLDQVRKRRVPIVGDGSGIWSFVQLDDAAAATVLALERGATGIYHVCDDEPAPVSVWLPELAKILGGPPPRRVPAWVGRLAAGEVGVAMFTQVSGASNEKAKRELGWKLAYPSWRSGFRDGLGASGALGPPVSL